MTNYKTYSYNAFVALKDEMKTNGYAFYQPHENAVIYANRYGDVLIWRSSNSGNTITIKWVKYPMPSELSADDFAWLQRIAKHKHWRGGVHKINYYLTLTADEIDERGIDPYFYAWLAQYHYEKKSESDFASRAILTESEYEETANLAELLCQPIENILETRVSAKKNDMSNDEFMLACIKIANEKKTEESRLDKAIRFVNSVAEEITDDAWKTRLAIDILDIVDKNTCEFKDYHLD